MKFLIVTLSCLLLANSAFSRGVKSPAGYYGSQQQQQQHVQYAPAPVAHREQTNYQQGEDQFQDQLDETVEQTYSAPRAPTKSIGQSYVAEEADQQQQQQQAQLPRFKSPSKTVVRQVVQQEQQQVPQAPTKTVKQVYQPQQQQQQEHVEEVQVYQRPAYPTKSKPAVKTEQMPERPKVQVRAPSKTFVNRKTVQRATATKSFTQAPQPQVYVEEGQNEEYQQGTKSSASQAPVKGYQRPVVIYVQEMQQQQVSQDSQKFADSYEEPARKIPQLPLASRKVPRAPVEQLYNPQGFTQ